MFQFNLLVTGCCIIQFGVELKYLFETGIQQNWSKMYYWYNPAKLARHSLLPRGPANIRPPLEQYLPFMQKKILVQGDKKHWHFLK